MRLIGMLDSPYVRRVAVTLNILDVPYAHEAVSVFRHFDHFATINPVVKAPTLITDDGCVLMDSTLIIEAIGRLVPAAAGLWPADRADYLRGQRIIGLALAACEKTVQMIYERQLRPADKQHQPWIDRVTGQLHAAYRLLEAEAEGVRPWLFGATPTHADIAIAAGWRFTQDILPGVVPQDLHPRLARLSAHAETTPAFAAAPPI